ncbi:MAG: hypothetical protein JO257_01425 [Deltaproteobacteria bacterium]|nr:hypothetical protein [Deltaproteobacteria bacterium]
MRAAALVLSVVALAGCACDAVGESTVVFHCRWQDPVSASAGSTVKICLNAFCASGAFGPAGSPTASTVELDGDLGPVTAQLAADSSGNGTEVTLTMTGGNGRYTNADTWTFDIAEPSGGGGFFASQSVTYVTRDGPCGSTYQTLDLAIIQSP